MINRWIFALSLFGVLLSVHIWIQKSRNFDAGCWGVGSTMSQSQSGCNDPILKRLDSAFGVPIVVLGFFFYSISAVASAGRVYFSGAVAKYYHLIGQFLSFTALPASVFLLYVQFSKAHAYCVLCLISAFCVAAIFILHLLLWMEFSDGHFGKSEISSDITWLNFAIFTWSLLSLAVLLFVNGLGTRRIGEGSSVKDFEVVLSRVLPKFIESDILASMRPAAFSDKKPRIASKDWIGSYPPIIKRDSASHCLVAFLDPNCPHCYLTYKDLKALARTFDGSVSVYVIPRVLWNYSVLQSQALEVARDEGFYFEMWDKQFEKFRDGGLGSKDIVNIFEEIGVTTGNIGNRLDNVNQRVRALRSRAIAAGVYSTPAIYINDIPVDSGNVSLSGLSKLVLRVTEPKLGAESPRVDSKQIP